MIITFALIVSIAAVWFLAVKLADVSDDRDYWRDKYHDKEKGQAIPQ